MEFRERLEKHWFVVMLLIAAVSASTTWAALNELLVRPRDEEFDRLKRRLEELEARQQVPPTPSDVSKSTVAKALDGVKPSSQASARVAGPPIDLKSTGTSIAKVEIPPSRLSRQVVIQASARSAAGPGGTMDLIVSIDDRECNRSSVYRNPAADPLLVATASCVKELRPSARSITITAKAPNPHGSSPGSAGVAVGV
jgi:hypothetical protein